MGDNFPSHLKRGSADHPVCTVSPVPGLAVSSAAKLGALPLGICPIAADSTCLGPYANGFRTAALLSGTAVLTDFGGRACAPSSVFLAPEALVARSCAAEELATTELSAATFRP